MTEGTGRKVITLMYASKFPQDSEWSGGHSTWKMFVEPALSERVYPGAAMSYKTFCDEGNIFLIEIQLIYDIMWCPGVQHSDLTIKYIANCSPR